MPQTAHYAQNSGTRIAKRSQPVGQAGSSESGSQALQGCRSRTRARGSFEGRMRTPSARTAAIFSAGNWKKPGIRRVKAMATVVNAAPRVEVTLPRRPDGSINVEGHGELPQASLRIRRTKAKNCCLSLRLSSGFVDWTAALAEAATASFENFAVRTPEISAVTG